MKKITIAALTATTLGAGVVFYFEGSMEATLNHWMLKYPDADRKIAKKVYRRMLFNVMTGTLGVDIDNYTEEQMDELLRARYNIEVNK